MFVVFVYVFLTSTVSMTPIDDQEPSAVPPKTRIIGGTMTNIEMFPYAGTVELFTVRGLDLIAGCTIINPRSVLTVASSFNEVLLRRYGVRVGCTARNDRSDFGVHRVAYFIMNPTYHANRDGDLAIARIVTPMVLGSATMQAATLPAPYTNIPVNSSVTVIGWGSVSAISTVKVLPLLVRKVELRTVNQASCRSSYAQVDRNITGNVMCAQGDTPRGPCMGDKGAPLVFNNVVVGVTTFIYRTKSCEPLLFLPSVYAKVSHYIEWIRSKA